MKSSLDKKKIIKDTFSLLTRTFVIKAIQIPTELVVAQVLGPSDYGLLKIINYIPKLSKFGNISFSSVVLREVPHYNAQGKSEKSENIKNVGFSVDVVFSAVLSLIVVIIGLCYSDSAIKFGIIIAGLTLLLNQLNNVYAVNTRIGKEFSFLAKVTTISSLFLSVFTIISVFYLKIFGILLGGLLSAGLLLFLYFRRYKLVFRFMFEKQEFRRILKIAVPLTLGTIIFGTYGWSERVIVGRLFGLEMLGYYMLTVSIYTICFSGLGSIIQVLSIELYELLGRQKQNQDQDIQKMISKPTQIYSILIAFICGSIVLMGPYIIHTLMPKYKLVIDFLPLLAAIIWIRTVPLMNLTAMNSAKLNQQNRFNLFFSISLLTFILGTFLLSRLGFEMFSPMIAKLISFIVLALLAFLSTVRYLYVSLREFFRETLIMIRPAAFTLIFVISIRAAQINLQLSPFVPFIIFFLFYLPFIANLERKYNLIASFRTNN